MALTTGIVISKAAVQQEENCHISLIAKLEIIDELKSNNTFSNMMMGHKTIALAWTKNVQSTLPKSEMKLNEMVFFNCANPKSKYFSTVPLYSTLAELSVYPSILNWVIFGRKKNCRPGLIIYM